MTAESIRHELASLGIEVVIPSEALEREFEEELRRQHIENFKRAMRIARRRRGEV